MQSQKNITTAVVECFRLSIWPCDNVNCLKGMYIIQILFN